MKTKHRQVGKEQKWKHERITWVFIFTKIWLIVKCFSSALS